jgi:hypothetical protein
LFVKMFIIHHSSIFSKFGMDPISMWYLVLRIVTSALKHNLTIIIPIFKKE